MWLTGTNGVQHRWCQNMLSSYGKELHEHSPFVFHGRKSKLYGFRTSWTILIELSLFLSFKKVFLSLKFLFFCGSSWGASCLLCYRLLLSCSCRSRHSSESLHHVTVCFVMALRECGFPRQLHALSASCLIAVLVAPSAAVGPRAPDPLTGWNPHSFPPLPHTHAPGDSLRNTRSLA